MRPGANHRTREGKPFAVAARLGDLAGHIGIHLFRFDGGNRHQADKEHIVSPALLTVMQGGPLGNGHIAPFLRTSPLAVVELFGVCFPSRLL